MPDRRSCGKQQAVKNTVPASLVDAAYMWHGLIYGWLCYALAVEEGWAPRRWVYTPGLGALIAQPMTGPEIAAAIVVVVI